MKYWKCTVCGYIHKGDQPPDKCPVCGASADKFMEISAKEAKNAGKTADSSSLLNKLGNPIVKRHLHSIAVHIPNGVIPAAVLFLFLALLLDHDGLSKAAFYNTIFIATSLPAVLLFGVVSWKKRYGGKVTSLFKIKAIGGSVVFISALLVVLWRAIDPDVADGSSAIGWIYFLIHVIMLGATIITGHQGGKLVFGGK